MTTAWRWWGIICCAKDTSAWLYWPTEAEDDAVAVLLEVLCAAPEWSLHAFDADHIAAIDNTTRELMEDGKRPLSVGFWFSLGHSSVVFGLTFLLALGVKAVGTGLADDDSRLHQVGGLIGTLVSGAFLVLIAAINLVILIGLAKVFARMRRGQYDEAAHEEQLNNRGFMNRLLGRATRAIRKPWQMYPLGILFGLGFDTVTEISLLVLAAWSVASGLPWYAILCLPVLFAAGMSLLDTIDGSFMNFAYGWAFSKPVRKVYYNLTITGLSIAVALIIGGIATPSAFGSSACSSSPGSSLWRCGSSATSRRSGSGGCTRPRTPPMSPQFPSPDQRQKPRGHGALIGRFPSSTARLLRRPLNPSGTR